MAIKKKMISETVSEVPQRMPETQLQVFDRAVKLFRLQDYLGARELFERAAQGSLREVAHNARVHINMCDRRLDKPEIQLRTLEDFYNVGVERLNARDFEGAKRNLQQALDLTRRDGDSADHVYYAMAACLALTGDSAGAYENLKRAIELEPRNRVAARQDPDFAGAALQQALQPLLHPDKAPF
jgi:tetratricopeptide (TPR) repeat protein